MEISGLPALVVETCEEESEDLVGALKERKVRYFPKSEPRNSSQQALQNSSMILCMSRPPSWKDEMEAEVKLEKEPDEKPTASCSVIYRGTTKEEDMKIEGKIEANTDGKVSADVKVSKKF